jgi:hypothetical protein
MTIARPLILGIVAAYAATVTTAALTPSLPRPSVAPDADGKYINVKTGRPDASCRTPCWGSKGEWRDASEISFTGNTSRRIDPSGALERTERHP